MCTRVLYESGTGYLTGRNMDWNDPTAPTALWIFPKGMQRDGGIGAGSLTWTSTHGSVVASFYDMATADGVNDAGLAGGMLYLAESDYGDAATTGKPTISVGAWLQYILDCFGSVVEAVDAVRAEPFTVVTKNLPNGRSAAVHVALSDPTGDSAILEYIDGSLSIHHSPDDTVMTNSPVYDQQLAINSYWELIGGRNMLPGTISAADRYVRASYNLNNSPQFKGRREAVASIFSQMRSVGVPLGMSDPDKSNIASTLWRTVVDHDAKRYYFDSVLDPSVIWVDLDSVDLGSGAQTKTLRIGGGEHIAGDVSGKFIPAEPFPFMAP